MKDRRRATINLRHLLLMMVALVLAGCARPAVYSKFPVTPPPSVAPHEDPRESAVASPVVPDPETERRVIQEVAADFSDAKVIAWTKGLHHALVVGQRGSNHVAMVACQYSRGSTDDGWGVYHVIWR